MNFNSLVIYILSFTLFTSCGYFSDDAVEDSEIYRSENLAGGCEIDTEELAQILEKDVEVQINCLEENLDKFAKYVKRENEDAITSKELSSFIRRFFTGHATLMVGSIKLLFDISGVVLSDNSSSLKTKNIKPLFELLRVVNKKLYKLMNTLEGFDAETDSVEETSELINKELSELVIQLRSLIAFASEGASTDLNLKSFIINLKDQFDLEIINLELLDALLSFKKLFLGGEKEILTQAELLKFLEMIPDLGAISFRLFFASEDSLGGTDKLYTMYATQMKTIESFAYPHKRDETIISRQEIESLLATFIDDGITIEADTKKLNISFDDLMLMSDSLKQNILGLGTNREEYSFQEVSNFLRVVESALGLLSVNEKYKQVVKGGVTRERWSADKDYFLTAVSVFKDDMIKNWANNEFFPNYIKPIPFIRDVVDLIVEDFSYKSILPEVIGIGKVSLLGGDREQLTKDQLIELLLKLNGFFNVLFDFLNTNSENHTDQEVIKLRFEEIKILRELLDGDLYLHVATVDELLMIGKEILDDEVILTYEPTIIELKKKLLGGYGSTLTLRDIKTVVDYVIEFYGQRYFASISYDLYAKELSSKKAVKAFRFDREHDDFILYTPTQLQNYKEKFVEMVSKIRLYRDENGYQFYGDTFSRTKVGLLEHYMIDFAFQLLGKALGHENEDGEYEFNLTEVNNLLFAFKPVLIDFGLWSAKPETFGRNTLLLADLFQANSNGSVTVDAMEISEYATLALFAIKAGDEVIEKTNQYCEQYTLNGSTGFQSECYRKHFFDILLNQLDLKKYLPKLTKYLNESSDEEVMEFLVKIEGFAKDYPEPDMPQARRDMVLLVGAMLNIESTFLRYDSDASNVLEVSELEAGFPVYEEAIIGLAKLEGGKRKYAKTIFLYMIKEMKTPTTTDLLFYHYNPFSDKEISSKRINIGALLYNMVMVKH